MTSYIGPITNSIIENFINEMKKPSNVENITSNIINPLMCAILTNYYPYIIMIFAINIVTLILCILILIFIINKKNL